MTCLCDDFIPCRNLADGPDGLCSVCVEQRCSTVSIVGRWRLLGADGTPVHLAGDGGSLCGAPVALGPVEPGRSFTCSACYLRTREGWLAHLRLVARDPQDPRRAVAVAELERISA